MNPLKTPRYFSRLMTPQDRLEASRTIMSTGCWETTYAPAKSGYPHMLINHKHVSLHRLAYTLYIGPIPEKARVLHTCDNSKCHNPEHLFIGTAKDNTQDMMQKGRHNRVYGTKCNRSQLTDVKVKAIRKSFETNVALAQWYGVSPSVISKIRNRKIWTHVE